MKNKNLKKNLYRSALFLSAIIISGVYGGLLNANFAFGYGGGGGGGGSYTPSAITSVGSVIFPTSLTIGNSQSGILSQTLTDGAKVELTVPQGAVSNQTSFKVTENPLGANLVPAKTSGAFMIGNHVFHIDATDTAGKDINKFPQALTVTLDVPSLPANTSNLGVYYYSETDEDNGTEFADDDNDWVLIPNASFDPATGKVIFSVNHLTNFAVFNVAGLPATLAKNIAAAYTSSVSNPVTPAAGTAVTTAAPTGPAYQYLKNLNYGLMKSNDVKMLQNYIIAQNKGPQAKALKKVGATGNFYALTKAALMEYQKAVKLPATGNLDDATRNFINTGKLPAVAKYNFTKDLKLGAVSQSVRDLQNFLMAQNKGVAATALKKWGATGNFVKLTKAALMEYQKSVNLPATGNLDKATRDYINGLK